MIYLTGSNFVSTKPFLDRNTGKMRANWMRDRLHYNEWGVRMLAKEVKKSLYSLANKDNARLTQILASDSLPSHAPPPSSPSSSFPANIPRANNECELDENHGA